MISKCPACRGHKKVMRLGMTMKDCETCSGKGHISPLPFHDKKPDLKEKSQEISELMSVDISENFNKKINKNEKSTSIRKRNI